MNKTAKYAMATLLVSAVGFTALSASADWCKRGKCARSGQEGAPQSMMMYKGKQGKFADRNLDLTADEAKTLVEAKLIMHGNDRLKAGQVIEKDSDTFLVDIVTVDNSLVRQLEVDRDKGLPRGPRGLFGQNVPN